MHYLQKFKTRKGGLHPLTIYEIDDFRDYDIEISLQASHFLSQRMRECHGNL
jgi:hypothetical protein